MLFFSFSLNGDGSERGEEKRKKRKISEISSTDDREMIDLSDDTKPIEQMILKRTESDEQMARKLQVCLSFYVFFQDS